MTSTSAGEHTATRDRLQDLTFRPVCGMLLLSKHRENGGAGRRFFIAENREAPGASR
ncbi:MAG: hypothetical protein GX418_02635 [Clostridiales bacterium]|nr:hypothetical protein [Clostridiales bacterium]